MPLKRAFFVTYRNRIPVEVERRADVRQGTGKIVNEILIYNLDIGTAY